MRFIFLLAILLFTGCENDPADIKAFFEKMDTSVETAKEVEILYSDSAVIRVKILAPTMLRYLDTQEPYQEFPDGVHVEFFDAAQRVSSTLTSNYAIRYERESKIVVQDSVVWQSVAGEKLESEELVWDEKTQKVFTNKFVVITRPDEIIYGHGFEANQDFSYSKIKAIEGRLKVDDIGKELE
jgi:LPS export ABC transporter protein LptC